MPTESEDGEVDFFVSYTGIDEAWATWIAWTLEKDGGFSTLIQAWDIAVGENFVLAMHKAARRSKRVIMVCSPEYLDRPYTAPEWAAIWRTDPQGVKAAVVPVIVRACQPDGLLGPLVRINLVGLDEDAARKTLLAGLKSEPGTRPTIMPAFPGGTSASAPEPIEPLFPAGLPLAEPSLAERLRAERLGAGRLGAGPSASETPTPEKPALKWEPFEGARPTVSRVTELVSAGRFSGREPGVELHMLPEPTPALNGRNFTDMGFQLIEFGRRHALFGPTAAVDLRRTTRGIAAVTASVPFHLSSGLALTQDGQRSVWSSAPLLSHTESAAPRESLDVAIAGLLGILLSLGSPLSDRVTFAMGITMKTSENQESTTWVYPLLWIAFKAAADDPFEVARWLTEQISTVPAPP